jgi:hypothetical protein
MSRQYVISICICVEAIYIFSFALYPAMMSTALKRFRGYDTTATKRT